MYRCASFYAYDDAFVVHGLRVIEETKGTFIAMPYRKGKAGNYMDTAHPINNRTREMIKEKVIEAFEQAV